MNQTLRGAVVRWVLSLSILALVSLAPVATPAWAQSSSSWPDHLRVSGDLRQRYEGFFQEGRTSRQRLRFRLRLSLTADISDDLTLGVRFGSGDLGNPISTNQSLTGVLTRTPIAIDRAFVAYNPSDVPALTIGAGKYGIPVTRTELTFDNDLNWQGLYQQVQGSNEGVSYRLVAAQVPLEESSSGADGALFATYGEVGVSAGDHSLQFSIANYAFRQVDRVAIALDREDISRNTNPYRFDANGNVVGFVSGFNLIDVIGRATLDTGRPDYPVQFTVNFVKNIDAVTDEDAGIWVTAAYGRASEPRSYRLAYTFARVEEDAVLSALNFSDMPGTNLKMHRVVVSYMVAPRVHLDFTGIFTTRLTVAPGALNTVLKRPQVDMRFSF
jgi:hypothetical protein